MASVFQQVHLGHHASHVCTSCFRVNRRVIALGIGTHLFTYDPHIRAVDLTHGIGAVPPGSLDDTAHFIARSDVVVDLFENFAARMISCIVRLPECRLFALVELFIDRLQARARNRLTDRTCDRFRCIEIGIVLVHT